MERFGYPQEFLEPILNTEVHCVCFCSLKLSYKYFYIAFAGLRISEMQEVSENYMPSWVCSMIGAQQTVEEYISN